MKKKLIISFLALFVLSACAQKRVEKKVVLSPEQATIKAEEFINNNLMQPGNKAVIKEVNEEGDLYKLLVEIAPGQEVESYISRDGSNFFPQVMNISEVETEAEIAKESQKKAETEQAQDIPKQAVADVELFVMSHCPYGTQIEKGMIPVIEALGDKMNFELKFCNYAMHDKKEIDEQLQQYCIQKEEKDKLLPYLKCFLKEGNSDVCRVEAGINLAIIDKCIANTDKEFKIYEDYENKSTWKRSFPSFSIYDAENQKYDIQGSPGLVINGKKVSSRRDAASLLETICAGIEGEVEACKQELSSESPSPGFGFGENANGSEASCN